MRPHVGDVDLVEARVDALAQCVDVLADVVAAGQALRGLLAGDELGGLLEVLG